MAAVSALSIEPVDLAEIRPVSRMIALARSGETPWSRVFGLMDSIVGHELAGRWLTEELELAGVIAPLEERTTRMSEAQRERRRRERFERLMVHIRPDHPQPAE